MITTIMVLDSLYVYRRGNPDPYIIVVVGANMMLHLLSQKITGNRTLISVIECGRSTGLIATP